MMYNHRRVSRKNGEDGISPVVGVMLMLVVTIIIAAVVSAFAGGAVSGTQKAPQATVEIHIKNGGDNTSSYFSMKVLGVNDPIPTNNLKIITSWTTTDKSNLSAPALTGGNTTYAGIANVYISGELASAYSSGGITVPTGYGNGVMNWSNDTYHPKESQWGYFSLSSGTTTYDKPTNYGRSGGATADYMYSNAQGTRLDPMQALLGRYWYNLRQGDTVNVRILDAQSGKEIVDQKIIVEGQ